MNYLSVDSLAKHYGERVLFEGLTFGVSKGDKMALIANNGTGKSSLLKIISREIIPDYGTVTAEGSVFYCPQQSGTNSGLKADLKPDYHHVPIAHTVL